MSGVPRRAAGTVAVGSALLICSWIMPADLPGQGVRRPSGTAGAAERAQTPRPPFPYEAREVTVGAEVELGCTETRPFEVEGGAPGVVLLTVAGPNDRDQSHSGHKPFMVLADHLTKAGMVVLRCDDRGVGASGGATLGATLAELVADAGAMIEHLKREPAIGPVGVIGNSEGSVVGALATLEHDLAFVVLLGGVGVTGAELIRERLLGQATALGLVDEALDQALRPFDELVPVVLSAGGSAPTPSGVATRNSTRGSRRSRRWLLAPFSRLTRPSDWSSSRTAGTTTNSHWTAARSFAR